MRAPSDFVEIFLQPGDFYFGDADTRIRTLLGSCVSITLWHPTLRIGGMCHYLLPTCDSQKARGTEPDGRYGDEAIQLFVREISARGTKPEEYEAKVFGGGNMFPRLARQSATMDIGNRNIALAKSALEQLGLTVKAKHVGDAGHRAIIFDVWSGDVWVKYQRLTGDVQPAAIGA